MPTADDMLAALNALKDVKHKHRYTLTGPAQNELHMAVVHMERATADALLAERRRVTSNDGPPDG